MAAPTVFGAASWAKAVAGAVSSASADVTTPAWKSLVCMATDSTSSEETGDKVRYVRKFRKSPILAATLVVAIAAAHAQQTAPTREPASKAAAILTWPATTREQYIAALDSFFQTRTVKAGPHPHPLDRGRFLTAFEAGGSRADAFDRFMTAQRVRG